MSFSTKLVRPHSFHFESRLHSTTPPEYWDTWTLLGLPGGLESAPIPSAGEVASWMQEELHGRACITVVRKKGSSIEQFTFDCDEALLLRHESTLDPSSEAYKRNEQLMRDWLGRPDAPPWQKDTLRRLEAARSLPDDHGVLRSSVTPYAPRLDLDLDPAEFAFTPPTTF